MRFFCWALTAKIEGQPLSYVGMVSEYQFVRSTFSSNPEQLRLGRHRKFGSVCISDATENSGSIPLYSGAILYW